MLSVSVTAYRADTIDVWQARRPECWSHHGRTTTAVAGVYSGKSMQDLGLAGLPSRGGPGIFLFLEGAIRSFWGFEATLF